MGTVIYKLRTNDSTVYFDLDLAAGTVRLADGAYSEQCDGCGADISEVVSTHGFYRRGTRVFARCPCGSSFEMSPFADA
jgi:hypothetical protein